MKPFFFNFKIKKVHKYLLNYVKNIFYIQKFYVLVKKNNLRIITSIYQNLMTIFCTTNKLNLNTSILFTFSLFFFKLNNVFKHIKSFNLINNVKICTNKVILNNFLSYIYINYFKYILLLNYFYINKIIVTKIFITKFYFYVYKTKMITFNTKLILIIKIYNKILKIFKIKLKNLNIFFDNLNLFYLIKRINFNKKKINSFNINSKSDIKYSYKEINLFFFKNKLNRFI